MDGREIADELLACLGSGRPARRYPGLEFEEAYRVSARACDLRRGRGERTVGRKIGFTNTTIWPLYGVSGPIWGYMYDTTVRDLGPERVSLAGVAEPRIEPEIVLGLGAAPRPGMTEAEILGCVEWVAHGFEVVQSVYPGWTFSGAEAAAAFGLHGGLFVGPRHPVADDRQRWGATLGNFGVRLKRNGAVVAEGHARHVLGGPVSALRFLVEEIARHPGSEPLAAGEMVTTGTLTDAQPMRPGDVWSTELDGIGIDGIRLATGEAPAAR